MFITRAQIALRIGIALRGGLLEPLHGFHGIFFHAASLIIEDAHLVLRGGKPLVGRAPEPRHGFLHVLRHAESDLVTVSHVQIAFSIALISGLAEPGHGLSAVLGHAQTVFITFTQQPLGVRVAGLRHGTNYPQYFSVLADVIQLVGFGIRGVLRRRSLTGREQQ